MNISKAFTLSLFLLPSIVLAEQRVAANEQVPHTVAVSRSSLSRVAIDGSRITSYKYLEGDLQVVKDKPTSQLYIRALTSRDTSLYIVSAEGKTYQLILKPSAKQGDSIIIDVAAQKRMEASLAAGHQTAMPVTSNSAEYIRAIKQFVIAIMSGSSNSLGIRSKQSYETIPLWQDTVFIKTNQYIAADMQADVYSLTNIGAKELTIREQEFYRPDVYAVAVRNQQLKPGEMTDVFIVRKLGDY